MKKEKKRGRERVHVTLNVFLYSPREQRISLARYFIRVSKINNIVSTQKLSKKQRYNSSEWKKLINQH